MFREKVSRNPHVVWCDLSTNCLCYGQRELGIHTVSMWSFLDDRLAMQPNNSKLLCKHHHAIWRLYNSHQHTPNAFPVSFCPLIAKCLWNPYPFQGGVRKCKLHFLDFWHLRNVTYIFPFWTSILVSYISEGHSVKFGGESENVTYICFCNLHFLGGLSSTLRSYKL